MGHKDKKRDRSSSRHKSSKSKKNKESKRSRSRSRKRERSRDRENKKYKNDRIELDEQTRQTYDLSRNDKITNEIIKQELGYTNEENPFGDRNLGEKFVWKRKGNDNNINKNNQQQQQDNDLSKYQQVQKQIQEVKQQRINREQERKKLEEEKQRAQKEKDDEQFQQWIEKETKFNEELIKVRALVRMNFGQETPLDTLVKIYYVYRGKIRHEKRFEYLMTKPNKFLKSIQDSDLEKIISESQIQKRNISQQQVGFGTFWESVEILCNEILQKRGKQSSNTNQIRKNELTDDFIEEVKGIYHGKNIQELQELEQEINQTMSEQDEFELMDSEYWANVLKLVKIYKAKVTLKNYYTEFRQKLDNGELTINTQNKDQGNQQEKEIEEENQQEKEHESLQLNFKYQQDQDNQREFLKEKAEDLSPKKKQASQIFEPSKNAVITEHENMLEIMQQRSVILEKMLEEAKQKYEKYLEQKKLQEQMEDANDDDNQFLEQEQQYNEGIDTLTQQAIQQQKLRKLDEDEEIFEDVYKKNQAPKEAGQDLLKRPEFHNTVKMQYDWNKYNQAHYDKDNPPPKIITGYKFNIFYRELADKNAAPQYFLENCQEDNRFLILRFTAGPPYEDISFKILNKEWNLMDKKGFKCVYSKGILHLYFNFKRSRYRR